jgi:curli production assembly/transport component CsgF
MNAVQMNSKSLTLRLVPALLISLLSLSAAATPLVYTPVNPNFGGNPLNGPQLLNEATAQNKHGAPSPPPLTTAQQLNNFANTLQNAILSRVSSALLNNIISAGGTLVPGTVETANYIITVVDKGNGTVEVTTTDKQTGQSTTFDVTNSPGP